MAGRRRPPNRPSLEAIAGPEGYRLILELWRYVESAFSGLGLAHAETHLPDSEIDPLTVGTPVSIGMSNSEGDDDAFSRSDHVHASGLTTKGDLLTVDTALTRLPVGANGTILTADSAETKGIKWGAAPAPIDAEYVVVSLNGTLTNERRLQAEASVLTLTDGGANGDLTVSVAADGISNTKLRNSGALSVIGRSANSSGDPADISAVATSGAVLRESGSTLLFGTVSTNGIANDAVTYAKLQDVAGFSVIGRAQAGAQNPADITAADETVLGRTGGGNLAFASLATGQITNDAVTYAKLQNVAGFSVVGKATTGAGDAADITAADETVLGRTGAGNVAFAQLATGQITDAAVTYAKVQDVSAASKLLGRGDSGSGDVQEITVGAGLTMTGTTLETTGGGGGAPTNAQYVTLALDATLSQERVLTGTANQITVTDGGANTTVTLATPQNIHTGAEPTFAGMTFTGEEVNFQATTPATLTGSVNDYNPGNGVFFRIGADASGYDITGIAGGANGRVIIYRNISNFTIDILNQSASSSATNRIICTGNTDMVLDRNSMMIAVYDATTQRWNAVILINTHNLLSATHGDTVARSATVGALVVGTASGWDHFVINTDAGRVLTTTGGTAVPAWQDPKYDPGGSFTIIDGAFRVFGDHMTLSSSEVATLEGNATITIVG